MSDSLSLQPVNHAREAGDTPVSQAVAATLRDGSRVTIRPIEPQDIERERKFIESLSPEARRYRFGFTMRSPSAALLKLLTDIDPERDAALIAVVGVEAQQRQVGVARYSTTSAGKAEVAVTVSDDWQNKGLATALMQHLVDLARRQGIELLYSSDAASNEPMRKLAAFLGFGHEPDPDDAKQVIYTLRLKPTAK
jgi:GNAT superfamily N-acetyltransferase